MNSRSFDQLNLENLLMVTNAYLTLLYGTVSLTIEEKHELYYKEINKLPQPTMPTLVYLVLLVLGLFSF